MSNIIEMSPRDDDARNALARRLTEAQCNVWKAWAIATAIERGWHCDDYPELNYLAQVLIDITHEVGAALDVDELVAPRDDETSEAAGGAA